MFWRVKRRRIRSNTRFRGLGRAACFVPTRCSEVTLTTANNGNGFTGALGASARILIFDEPTSSLSNREVENLCRVIGELRREGEQTEFWTQEAIEYLGFNRLDVARPDMLLQRLIKKGALRPTKIGRRNVFKKADLDRVREKGDQVRRRGRPRKDEK
jgi:hypothetical protein